MERRRLQIPSGMQDTLPGECAGKRRLEDKLRRLFTLGGYQEIETPILEYYDALDDQTFGYRPEQVWKTFDPQARILAVRPDSTIPAVRLASGRLKNAPLPLRLRYVQSAAKLHSETLSLLCQDTQAGVELMGEGSAQADAEVIALAVEALARRRDSRLSNRAGAGRIRQRILGRSRADRTAVRGGARHDGAQKRAGYAALP